MKSALAFLLYLAAFPSPLQAQTQPQQEWDQLRDEAESRFEIVKILIKQGKFDGLLTETGKLFSVHFPPEQEYRLSKSAVTICKLLTNTEQVPLAHKVIDQAIEAVSRNQLKADLYKEKAYLFKMQGKDDEAMKCFERALQLQGKN